MGIFDDIDADLIDEEDRIGYLKDIINYCNQEINSIEGEENLAEGKLLKENNLIDDIDAFVDSNLYDSEEDDFSNLKNFLKLYPQYVGQKEQILSKLYAPPKVQRFKDLNENDRITSRLNNLTNFLNH